MINPNLPVEHIDDGELVRYLDNELELEAVARVRRHLAACRDCQAKFDALRERAESFRQAMAGIDLPAAPASEASVPSIHRSPTVSRGWRMAAMIAVVIGITLTVTPARAWLLETMRSVKTLFQPADQAPPTTIPDIPVTGSSVRFAVSDSVLFLEFAVRPKSGTLSVQRGTSETQVSATMQGGTGDDELVVFPDGVRVVNTTESTADYGVTLPTTVVMVEVRVARVVVARHRPGMVAAWSLELGR